MTTDWRSPISGLLGSGAVHATAGLLLLAALTGTHAVCLCNVGSYELMRIYNVREVGPSFSLAPLLLDHDHVFKIDNIDCTGRRTNYLPKLVGRGRFPEERPMPRSPKVCIRVEPNGQVTWARVLLSSGDRAIDAAVEAHARDLVFEEAGFTRPARAVSVTLEVIGGRHHSGYDRPIEPAQPLLEP